MAQMKSGRRNQVESRSAHLVHGDDEVQSGEDGRETGDENAEGSGNYLRVRESAAVGRVKSPAGVDAAGNYGVESEGRADDVNVPAHQVDARESQVARADHQRHEEIAQGGRDGRHQEEKDHDDAVHGEELVVGFRRYQALGFDEVQAHQDGEKAANEKHQSDGDEIEDGDALVVNGQQPGLHAVIHVEVIQAFFGRTLVAGHLGDQCGAHLLVTFLSSGPSDLI